MSDMNYLSAVTEAQKAGVAIGHFNISNLEGLWGIFQAAKTVAVPVIIGVSEGEREFIGIRQARALVDSIRDEFSYPIWLNADHTYTFEGVKAVVDAGYDSVIFDGSKLPLAENIKITKQCVDYAKAKNPDILVEGELGYIGTSSKLLDEIPDEVVASASAVTPELALEFVQQTGVDFLSPAVGNLHGMLKGKSNPNLNISRIKAIVEAVKIPLVLHGGSGISDEDFKQAIKAGIAIVHINTEIRLAFASAVKKSFQDNPDEIAPYRLMKPAVNQIAKVTADRLRLFSGKENA